jgi:hypothetical protein
MLLANQAERMLVLLGAACAETAADDLASMPIGCRDTLLLELRARLFGPEVTAVAPCPRCGDSLESTFDVDDVRVAAKPAAGDVLHLEVDGFEVAFRLPSTNDLLALADASQPQPADLLTRCVVEVRGATFPGPPSPGPPPPELPADVLAAIERTMADADPQADIELALSCPTCGLDWSAPFDIDDYLWAEVHAWAQRLLRDVHQLARAYGWREHDVLALSPVRRGVYLELSRQ